MPVTVACPCHGRYNDHRIRSNNDIIYSRQWSNEDTDSFSVAQNYFMDSQERTCLLGQFI